MKILVIGPSWVGDMMMSQSLYRTIKSKHHDATIDVMALACYHSLLTRMPEVNKVLVMPLGHSVLALSERYRLGKSLQVSGYDRAYVLPNSFKAALIPFFAVIKHRIGWRGEMRYGVLNDIRILDKTAFPLMVERYVALCYEQPIASSRQLPQPVLRPQLKVNEDEKCMIKSHFALSADRPLIGFCPGAEFGPAKRWPHYHYAVLAEQLIGEGYQVILLGSTKDHEIGNTIMQILSEPARTKCKNLMGYTQLGQAVMLLSTCAAVISNDSGLMHISAALNCSLVALYGPSSPDFTPPLSNTSSIVHLKSGYQKVRKGDAQHGYHHSLIDIHPSRVHQELTALLHPV